MILPRIITAMHEKLKSIPTASAVKFFFSDSRSYLQNASTLQIFDKDNTRSMKMRMYEHSARRGIIKILRFLPSTQSLYKINR